MLRTTPSWIGVTLVLLSPTVVLSQAPTGGRTTPRVLVEIDGASEDLSALTTMAASIGGRLAISQVQDGTLRIFAPNGAPMATVGRKGSGPGEFRTINRIGWVGDTVWVVDNLNHRLTFIGPTGTVLRSEQLPTVFTATLSLPQISGLRSPSLVAIDAFGMPYFVGRHLPADSLVESRTSISQWRDWLVRGNIDGTIVTVLARGPTEDCRRRRPGAVAYLPLCPRSVMAFAPVGVRMAHVTMDIPQGAAGGYHLTIIGAGGDTITSRKVPVTLERVPQRVRDSTTDEMPQNSPQIVELLRGYTVPSWYPPVTRIVVGANGDVWVGLWLSTGAVVREWHLFDGSGAGPRSVWLLRSDLPITAERRGVWSIRTHDDETESIVLLARP